MSDDYVQLADGSYREERHTNRCCFCGGRFLKDEAKDRGDGRVICEGCARKHNINFCRVCGRAVDFEYNGAVIYRCNECKNRTTTDDKKNEEERRILEEIINYYYGTDLYTTAVHLIRLGDLQKAGLVELQTMHHNSNKRWSNKRWS